MNTIFLGDLSRRDNKKAGNKAAILGELQSHNIPVPPGFVVTAEAYRSFLEQTDVGVDIAAHWHNLNPDSIRHIEETSRAIRALFHETPMPRILQSVIMRAYQKLDALYVAVRSSAVEEDGPEHSWAGELESFMQNTEENLIDRVKECWSSLFTPRAINYRFAHELHGQEIDVAVLVQDMIHSDVAGVCFTAHPITNDPNELLIEAAWGLGTTITNGLVTPDSYIYDRKENIILAVNREQQTTKAIATDDGEIKEVELARAEGETQKLTRKQIVDLAKLCLSTETILGAPQNIEWAMENDNLWILQSRALTKQK